jgi:transcriptional regulator with XRE-family HTH domain
MTGQAKNDRSRVVGWSPEAAGRLKAAVKGFGAQGQVAELAGISRPSLVEILSGRSIPTNQTFERLCRVLGIAEMDILGGEIRPDREREPLALVPFHDVRVSAGHGQSAVEAGDSPANLGFPEGWLRRQFGDPRNLRVVQAKGDSMAPTLGDNDLVMIDISRRDPVDGIFVLRLEDQLMVKRVHFPSARRVLVTSDNRDYDRWDRLLDLEDAAALDGFQLIGRVVWVGKSL